MERKPFVITIVGPESSGKTTLARQLANDIGCPWVPEYAREYLEELDREYNEADLLLIAGGQLESINKGISSPQSPVFSSQSSVFDLQWKKENNGVLIFQREDFGNDPRPVVIVDSGMMSIRVWAKLKYKMTIPVVEEALDEDITSMYILCRPVLPWHADPLREAPLLLNRSWIYNHYLQEIFTIPAK